VPAPEAPLPQVQGQEEKKEHADCRSLEKERLGEGEDRLSQTIVNDLGAIAQNGNMPMIQGVEDGAEGVAEKGIDTQGKGADKEGEGVEDPRRLDPQDRKDQDEYQEEIFAPVWAPVFAVLPA
jgi:hypothetical protein